MRNKGFTLVELLAVIVILAIILVIAVPKITNLINNSKDDALINTTKIIAGSIEKEYEKRQLFGENTTGMTCSDVVNLSSDEYDSCTAKFVESTALIDIVGKGKFGGKYVCNGTKEEATVTDENCNTYAASVLVNSGNMVSDETVNNNFRYSGANPDNYVTFNGEVWRVIGIFNVNNGTETEKRVKIIRGDSVGSYSWDSSESGVNNGYGLNDWNNSDLMTELNSVYYNKTSGNCYNGMNNVSTSCNFSTIGLNDTAKSMVENAIWNLGGTVYSNPSTIPYGLPTLDTYNKERGITVYSGRSTTWTGIVGLLYPSDYGYSSTDVDCRTNLRSGITYSNYTWNYSGAKCKNNNWLQNSTYYWTLTPYSSSAGSALIVRGTGIIDYSSTSTAFGVRPVVYLKSNVKITSGTGTSTSPYILSL